MPFWHDVVLMLALCHIETCTKQNKIGGGGLHRWKLCLPNLRAGGQTGRQTCRLFAGWPTGRLDAWPDDCLAGWLVGWRVNFLTVSLAD